MTSSRNCLRPVLIGLALVLAGNWACTQTSGPPRHYDDPKHMIEVFDDKERDAWTKPDQVIRALQIDNAEALIADIGAGSGYFSWRLAREVPGGKVYAVDIDDTFREHIESNREGWGTPNIEPHLAFFDDPALPEQALDIIFMSNTYSYIRDRVSYLEKIRTALKPGGTLVLISFKPESDAPPEIAPETKYRVPKQTALAELKQAGFVLEREETFLPYQYFLILKVP